MWGFYLLLRLRQSGHMYNEERADPLKFLYVGIDGQLITEVVILGRKMMLNIVLIEAPKAEPGAFRLAFSIFPLPISLWRPTETFLNNAEAGLLLLCTLILYVGMFILTFQMGFGYRPSSSL